MRCLRDASVELEVDAREVDQPSTDDEELTSPYVEEGVLEVGRWALSVIATGHMRGATFVADEVLAKHDETYMPKEVADKMGKAHRKHDVKAGAPTEPPMAPPPEAMQ